MAGSNAALACASDPTSSSWLNQVERFIALLTNRKSRRCGYRSVAALSGDEFTRHGGLDHEELAKLGGTVPSVAFATTRPVAMLRAANSDVMPCLF